MSQKNTLSNCGLTGSPECYLQEQAGVSRGLSHLTAQPGDRARHYKQVKLKGLLRFTFHFSSPIPLSRAWVFWDGFQGFICSHPFLNQAGNFTLIWKIFPSFVKIKNKKKGSAGKGACHTWLHPPHTLQKYNKNLSFKKANLTFTPEAPTTVKCSQCGSPLRQIFHY